jgi:hypothetical protein
MGETYEMPDDSIASTARLIGYMELKLWRSYKAVVTVGRFSFEVPRTCHKRFRVWVGRSIGLAQPSDWNDPWERVVQGGEERRRSFWGETELVVVGRSFFLDRARRRESRKAAKPQRGKNTTD